jgi:hypothetical protein
MALNAWRLDDGSMRADAARARIAGRTRRRLQ